MTTDIKKTDILPVSNTPSNLINSLLDLTPDEAKNKLAEAQMEYARKANERISRDSTVPKKDRIALAKLTGLEHVFTMPDIVRTSMYTAGTIFLIYGLITNPTLKKALQDTPETAKQMVQNFAAATSQRYNNTLTKLPSIEISDKIKPALEMVKSKINHTPDCLQKILGAKQSAVNSSKNLLVGASQLTQQAIQTGRLAAATIKENLTNIGAATITAAIISEKTPETISSRVNKIAEKTTKAALFVGRNISKPATQTTCFLVKKTAQATQKVAILGVKTSFNLSKTGVKTAFTAVKTTPKAIVTTVKLATKAIAYSLFTTAKITHGTKKVLGLTTQRAPEKLPVNQEASLKIENNSLTRSDEENLR